MAAAAGPHPLRARLPRRFDHRRRIIPELRPAGLFPPAFFPREPIMATDTALLSVSDLAVSFATENGAFAAVDGLSFSVEPGQCVAVVGESGSGKSVTAMSILGLTRFNGGSLDRGRIDFRRRNGETLDLASSGDRTLQDRRGNEIAMIFQEPMTALNPVFTVGEQVSEVLRAHKAISRHEADVEALELIERVRIPE